MQPPVNIVDLMSEWSKDAKVNIENPNDELGRIPKLHAKYLNVMTHHTFLLRKAESNYYKLKKVKWEYYKGDLNNPEDLAKYGYEPWQGKTLRQDLPIYLDGDEELIELLMKKVNHEEIVEYCKYVLKEIGSRTFQLKALIDSRRFLDGG